MPSASLRRGMRAMRKQVSAQVASSERLRRTPLRQKSKPNWSMSMTGAQQRKSTQKATTPTHTLIRRNEAQRNRSMKLKHLFSEAAHSAAQCSFICPKARSEAHSLSQKMVSRSLSLAMKRSCSLAAWTEQLRTRNCGVSRRQRRERRAEIARGMKQHSQKMMRHCLKRKNHRIVASAPPQKHDWITTNPTCRRSFSNCSARKQKQRLKAFSRPSPIRNSPTSATPRLLAPATIRLPTTPSSRQALKVSLRPKLSTNGPVQAYPTMDPTKNMPIAVAMMSD